MKHITSAQNPLIKHLAKLVQDSSYRKTCSACVLEGIKICSELFPRLQVNRVLVTNPSLLPKGVDREQCILIPKQLLKKITRTVSPEGILAEVDLPLPASFQGVSRLLALDAISDPGNLGTLFRTADAFGWDGIFLLPGCADPYNDKAIRASKGRTLTFPKNWGSIEELAPWTRVGADLTGISLHLFSPPEKMALILGNEATGLSKNVKKQLQTKVTIPLQGSAESLNVAAAGAICLYAWRKQDG